MVSNQATQAAQDTQKQVETQKQNLTNQLVVSQDPNLAAQQAVSAAASISAPSITAPIGNLFQGVANTYLANQVGSLYPNPYPGQGGGAGTSFGRNESATGKNYYVGQ
jgi:sortase (surface protein transpeptidase)